MKYKKSMFNYIADDTEGVRLYNSLQGSESLILAKGDSAMLVKEILKSDFTCDKNADTKEYRLLREKGYIVPEYVDESLLRERKLMDIVNYSKLYLVIMPTEQCNFRCEYCYETHEKGKMSKETQDALIRYVQKNIYRYTGLNVGWFGGEPLEALDVIEYLSQNFMKICKVAKKPYKAGMTTNAYNLDEKTFRKLYGLNVLEYQISIDGLRDTHDSLRKLADGSGSFDTIISNIKAIRNISDIRFFNVDIRTNFTKTIAARLDEYLDYYSNLIGGDSRFSIQINKASDWGGETVANIKDDLFETAEEYVNLCREIAKNKKNINFSSQIDELDAGSFKCYAARKNSYCIGSDARVYKCTEKFDMAENNIGVLKPNGDMEINKYYESLWIATNYYADKDKCRRCSYSGCCLYSPCPKNTVEATGHVPCCPRNKHGIDSTLRLIDDDRFTVIE